MEVEKVCAMNQHRKPCDLKDKFALYVVRSLRALADAFFQKRYAHRAIVIETVAALPGMIGGALMHMRCLRKFYSDSDGWVQKLLNEAENERMHLMVFLEIAQPTWGEKILIKVSQLFFGLFYFLLYSLSSKIAHRFVGYLEEEAVQSYTQYLDHVINNAELNVPAPPLAIAYWNLKEEARLEDMIRAVRDDEVHHRDVNHHLADAFKQKGEVLDKLEIGCALKRPSEKR